MLILLCGKYLKLNSEVRLRLSWSTYSDCFATARCEWNTFIAEKLSQKGRSAREGILKIVSKWQ